MAAAAAVAAGVAVAAAGEVLMDRLISLIGFIKAERGLIRRDAPETTICPTKHLSPSVSAQFRKTRIFQVFQVFWVFQVFRVFRVVDVTVWFPLVTWM